MQLTEIAAPDFDLDKTLNSGQVFHWEKANDGYVGAIGDCGSYIEQRGDVLRISTGPNNADCKQSRDGASCGVESDVAKMVARYFALDHALPEICASFPDDVTMNAARDFCRGLRIIRQPKWECLATFICSSMKQVAHIRQISKKLRERFGASRSIGRSVVHAFPTVERIAQCSEKELLGCALGYRAKNLLRTARRLADRELDIEALTALPDSELRTALCQLPGVGAKVANCVMLFAYERLRAFPIDVWIERVLKEKYFARRARVTSRALREFSDAYFGDHGGYAQQYLFHHARMTRVRKAMPRRPARGGGRARPKCKAVRRSSSHDKKTRLT